MNFDVSLFFQALFSAALFKGALFTILLAIGTLVIAILMGYFLAEAKLSHSRVLRAGANTYIWLFRGVPTLLWLLVLWNALPQIFPVFRESWYTPFLAALIAFSLSEAAYMGEILRSAMISIDPGQVTAGRALGMSRGQIRTFVSLPQIIRIAIPPTMNEFITILKLTSLAYVISLQELMTVAQQQVSSTLRYVEWYSSAAIYYLVIVSIFMFLQGWLERRYRWKKRP